MRSELWAEVRIFAVAGGFVGLLFGLWLDLSWGYTVAGILAGIASFGLLGVVFALFIVRSRNDRD